MVSSVEQTNGGGDEPVVRDGDEEDGERERGQRLDGARGGSFQVQHKNDGCCIYPRATTSSLISSFKLGPIE